MIKLFLNVVKFSTIALVILLIGQIPVGKRRICDHVWDATHTRLIQTPIHWISERFVFTDHGGRTTALSNSVASHAKKAYQGVSRAAGTEYKNESVGDNDKGRLSGLLKN